MTMLNYPTTRKRNRLQNYDYSRDGWYFVTICAKNKEEFFGEIENNKIILNNYGKIAYQYWLEISNYYKNVQLDEFILMPNHIHGIIVIKNQQSVGTEQCSVPTGKTKQYGLLSKIVKSYKEVYVKYIRKNFNDYRFGWQR